MTFYLQGFLDRIDHPTPWYVYGHQHPEIRAVLTSPQWTSLTKHLPSPEAIRGLL